MWTRGRGGDFLEFARANERAPLDLVHIQLTSFYLTGYLLVSLPSFPSRIVVSELQSSFLRAVVYKRKIWHKKKYYNRIFFMVQSNL